MKYSIYDIANWFLNREPMTLKKLQKLCYYAKAWSTVFFNDMRLNCSFQAWAHGAVNTDLARKFRGYEWYNIDSDALRFRAKKLDEETKNLLESLWVTYGEYSGIQLENLIRSEQPWKNARKGYREHEPCDKIINEEDMRAYYTNMYLG